MAYQLVLPGNFSDESLPRFQKDPILTKGSVYLIDPTHPVQPWTEGVPTDGSSIPNLVGQSNLPDGLSSADFSFHTDGNLTGSLGKIERTSKGGLHVIVSQTQQAVLDTPNANYAAIADRTPVYNSVTPLRQWLYDGAYSHGFYMSLWAQITRPHKTDQQAIFISQLVNVTSSTGNYNVALSAITPPADSNHRPSSNLSSYAGHVKDTDAGPAFNAISSSTNIGSLSLSSNSAILIAPLIIGAVGTVNNYLTAKGASPSIVLYRAYLEDLTVSGRTHSEVLSIDQELYTRDVLTPGGRYYGDTFTDPATIP